MRYVSGLEQFGLCGISILPLDQTTLVFMSFINYKVYNQPYLQGGPPLRNILVCVSSRLQKIDLLLHNWDIEHNKKLLDYVIMYQQDTRWVWLV